MKWSIFKWGCLLFLLLGVPGVVCGDEWKVFEEEEKDSQVIYANRLQRYKKGWASLIPQYQKIQYAGSMGLISLGIGWDYGKKEQWETDLFWGYLPRFEGERGYMTMTLKETYIPWKMELEKGCCQLFPFSVSLYVNKIFGEDFWSSEPDKYPNGYYGLATNLRFNLAIGQRIQFKIKPIGLSEQVTLFYELGTSDLYLISYFTNKYLQLSDIFHFSFGIKLKFI